MALNIEDLRLYCLSKPAVTEGMPFGDMALVFKVMDKMFALLSLDVDPSVNLKCDPERALELREAHPEIQPGYHMNKKHWNTVTLDGGLKKSMVLELIDHSYDLVVAKLPKKLRTELENLE